jgi:hypothetical protein
VKHSKEELSKLLFPELRKLARKFGISPAGKQPPDLRREILKKQAKAGGKGTAADPVKTTKGKKEPSMAKASKAKKKAAEEVSDEDKLNALVVFAAEVAESLELDLPAALQSEASDDDEEEADEADEDEEEADEEESDDEEAEDEEEESDEEEEEEADEEAEDEDEDDEEEEKPKKGKAKAKKSKADDEDDDDDEEEADEEDEDVEEEVTITSEELDEAGLPKLKEIGEAINESTGKETIDVSIGSARILRKRIKEFLEKNADTEVEEAPTKSSKAPQWVKKGVKCKAKYEGSWFKVRVESVGKMHATCYFDEDESEAEVPFEDLKQLKK